MNLGFHFHVPAISDAREIFTPGHQGRFIDSLAVLCDQVTLFLHHPRSDELALMDYRIEATNVKLVDIGLHGSVPRRVLLSKQHLKPILENIEDLDILLIRGPSPLLPFIAQASTVPTVLMLVADYVAGVDALPQPRWRKELIRIWSYWNKWGQNQAARKSLVFSNSRVLYEENKKITDRVIEIRTTTLNEKDFYYRQDTCASRSVRILCSGRISTAKGFFDIAQAIDALIVNGEDVILDIVGWVEKGEGEIQAILEAPEKHYKSGNRIIYHGSKAVGDELFAYYRKADIFIIASRSFEGFPRTIWEAMAHGVPVVATRVGSIPSFIEGSAELVPPGDVEMLTRAITRLIHQPELRQQYIQRGYGLTRDNTLEVQTGKLMQEMNRWLEEQHA